MLSYKQFLIPLFLFFFCGILSSQTNKWIHFDSSNSGLPSNTIRLVSQAPDGIYWIGTWDAGLVKFDGKNWTVYNKDNSPLPHNCVYSIAFNNGNILIGTMGGGLAIFDGNSNWKIYNEKNSNIPQDWIYTVAVDKKQRIWIGTFSDGLGILENDHWINYNKTNSILTDNKVTYILIDKYDNKILATQGELAFIIDDTWKTEKDFNIDSLDHVAYWISEMHDGKKIISYKYKGVVLFDGKNFNELKGPKSKDGVEGFYSAVEDQKKKIWAGSFGQGIVIYENEKSEIWNKSNSPVKDDFIFNIFVDSKNNKWISTYFGGISVYNEDGVTIP